MSEAQKSPTTIDATVVVCTYNRSASLPRTLESLRAAGRRYRHRLGAAGRRQQLEGRYARVVESFCRSFPRARYCFEPRQGLSFARNHGIAQARGRYILFTDDDVAAEPDWVRRIVEGMTSSRCDACGGYIAPVWESPPPAWLTQRFHGFLAIKTERTDTHPISGDLPLPFGANMAFRRDVFMRFGLFDVTRRPPRQCARERRGRRSSSAGCSPATAR